MKEAEVDGGHPKSVKELSHPNQGCIQSLLSIKDR